VTSRAAGGDVKRIERDVLWTTGALLLVGVCGVATNFAIVALFDASALGVFNQVFAIYIVVGQFAVGGVQFSCLRYCSRVQGDRAECGRIATSGLLLVSLSALVWSLMVLAGRHEIGALLGSDAVGVGLGFAAPGVFFFALNKVLMSVMNASRHMRALAGFRAARVLGVLGGVGLVLVAEYPAPYLALSLTLAEVALCIGLVSYVVVAVCPIGQAALRTWVPRHVSFGARGFLSGVLIETNTRVDVLSIAYFMSDEAVGIYSMAAVIAEGFAQLTAAVRQNIDPIIGRAFAQDRRESITELAHDVRKRFIPAMAGLGALVLLGFGALLGALRYAYPGKGDFRSWGVCALLIAAVFLASGWRSFAGVILQGGRPGVMTMLMAGSVLGNILLNVLLIPVLGVYGAAIATGLVYLLEAGMIVVLSRRLFGVAL
jgi:O-antigen/teichoic acid export membrane protein